MRTEDGETEDQHAGGLRRPGYTPWWIYVGVALLAAGTITIAVTAILSTPG